MGLYLGGDPVQIGDKVVSNGKTGIVTKIDWIDDQQYIGIKWPMRFITTLGYHTAWYTPEEISKYGIKLLEVSR